MKYTWYTTFKQLFGSECMKKKYLTTLNTRPFLFRETTLIARLLKEGFTKEEIKNKVTEENILQLSNKDRAARFYSEIIKRLAELDETLFEWFVTSDTHSAKAILLYAIVKKDQLFFEWMREVVLDNFLVMDNRITKKETVYFLEAKKEQSAEVMNWSPNTIKRLMSAYHQVLFEAGMIEKNEEEYFLRHLILQPSIRNYLIEQKDRLVVEAVLGERI